jgi:fibro-slime domain-containing protein
MKLHGRNFAWVLGLGLAATSFADWNYNYYKLNGSSNAGGAHVDVDRGIDGGIVTGLVEGSLTGGIPKATSFATSGPFNSGPLLDIRSGGVLGWWTPSVADKVSFDSSGITTGDSFDTGAGFFATGESDNANYFRSAHWYGFAASSGAFDFSIAGDDDAWMFVNGSLVLDNGGVKAFGAASSITDLAISAGDRIDIFFADRNRVESRFAITTDADINAVPEPGTMIALGLGAAAMLRRRRKS